MGSERQDIREAYRTARALEVVARTMKFRHKIERDLAAGRVSKKQAHEMLSLADAVLAKVDAAATASSGRPRRRRWTRPASSLQPVTAKEKQDDEPGADGGCATRRT